MLAYKHIWRFLALQDTNSLQEVCQSNNLQTRKLVQGSTLTGFLREMPAWPPSWFDLFWSQFFRGFDFLFHSFYRTKRGLVRSSVSAHCTVKLCCSWYFLHVNFLRQTQYIASYSRLIFVLLLWFLQMHFWVIIPRLLVLFRPKFFMRAILT